VRPAGGKWTGIAGIGEMLLKLSAMSLWTVLLCLVAATLADANTITMADAKAALLINGSFVTAIKDIQQARKGLMQAGDFSANNYCVENILKDLMIIQSDVAHLAQLFTIGATMVDTSDETSVLEITKIATDQFLTTDAPAVREQMNRLSGICSQFPLPVAKALQSVGLIDQATTLVKSVSKRLQ
jgi:hypothetical protein